MPPDRVPIIQQMKITDAPNLEGDCLKVVDTTGEVLLGTRVFPDSDYKFFYSKAEILYVRAKLAHSGYLVDVKTVMDEKTSRLILTVEKEQYCQKDVKAEKLK
jgi:hypothetical protein